MRIDELVFQRVGAWRGQTLSLAPGLNLVLGPNEAGKSTALRAIEALLFEIPPRGSEVSLAELVAPLRVADFEASIRASRWTSDGVEQIAWRRRGSTFEWSDGRRLPSAELAAWMWDVSHRDYRLIYALGHERLRAGGRLFAAGGPLANVVADITGGVNGLPELRARLSQESDALYRQRGSNPRLNASFGALTEIRKARAARLDSESHGKYLELTRRIDELARSQARNRGSSERNDEALSTLTSLRAALPTILDAKALAHELTKHPYAAVDLDERWYARLASAKRETEEARDATHAAQARLTRATSLLEGRAASLGVLEHRVAIERVLGLAKTLEDHESLLATDAASESQARESLVAALDACGLKDAGELTEVAEALHRPRPTLDRLVDALTRLEKARLEATATAKRVVEHEAEHQTAVAALNGLPAPVPLDPLQDLRRRGRLAELEEELRQRRQRQAATVEGLRAVASRLGLPQHEDVRACLALRTPSRSEIQSHYDRATAIAQRKTPLEAELTGARKRLRENERQIASLASTRADPVDRETLSAARHERDEAMQALAAALGTRDSAPLLVDAALRRTSSTIRSVDDVTDRLLDDAKRIADLDAAERDRQATVRDIEGLEAAMAETLAARVDLDTSWATLWSSSGVEVTLDDRDWPSSYETFLRDAQTWQTGESSLDHDAARLASIVADVKRQLSLLDEELSCATLDRRLDEQLEAAFTQAETRRRAEDELKRTRGRLEAAQRDEASARASLDGAEAAFLEALNDAPAFVQSDRSVAEAWIARSREISMAAGAYLEKAQRVRSRIAEHADAITAVDDAWRLVVASAPTALSSPTSTDPRARLDALRTAYEFAIETDRRERERTDAMNAVADARRVATGASDVLRSVLVEAGLEVPESDLDDAVQRVTDLRALRDRLEQARRAACDGVKLSWPALESALGTHDLVTLDEEIARLREGNVALKHEGEALAAELIQLTHERDDLTAGESLASLSQRWEQAMGPMLAALEDTLATQGALLLLDEVEASIREDERLTAIADAASQHFARLTRGSFERVDFDAQRTSIVVTRGNGMETPLAPDALSDGTRDQLWLAFRLALIEQHMAAKRLPLVLDDVLVHFDPDRAKAALETFAKFAEHTQVLMFTHDPGLVELARQASLDFQLVELPPRDTNGPVPDPLALAPAMPTPRRAPRRDDGTSSALADDDGHDDAVDPADLQTFVFTLAARPDRKSGNKTLREVLGWSESRYDTTKAALVAAGRIKLGQGRGGSVTLLDPAPQDEPSS